MPGSEEEVAKRTVNVRDLGQELGDQQRGVIPGGGEGREELILVYFHCRWDTKDEVQKRE